MRDDHGDDEFLIQSADMEVPVRVRRRELAPMTIEELAESAKRVQDANDSNTSSDDDEDMGVVRQPRAREAASTAASSIAAA